MTDIAVRSASPDRLFLRPDMRIVREVAAAAADSQSQVDLDGSVADYDYDNDRDTADYCPEIPLSVSTAPVCLFGHQLPLIVICFEFSCFILAVFTWKQMGC